ncbi:recombinase RecT [Escherichia coli]|uniref:RecT family recombinase n=1 Tax=Escherichia coli TaxID=562 RepID=UPI001E2DF664|nr:RecT family recombinase [Escherichia coli]MCC9296988.1 recombinase RecT [Escherichia coli]MCC9301541.1 recombinase RecT [Escherichia coli]MCZ0409738.1 recombinase RecT [Escherichia coli]UIR42860.1 recombinase RecT [Escherichia coli]UUF71450.1 recombinase RecT [Escherichia coli]
MSNEIATMNTPVDTAIAGTAATIFSPEGLNQLMKFAEVMSQSRVTVPAHLAGKPADCMAVAMQAAQWGMNPFAVAQKTHVVSGTLGYEAQLVNAVITTMSPTKDRINYEWFGPWENVIGKFVEKTSQKGNTYIAPAWSLKDEAGCGVRVWATMKGEDKPRVLELLLSQAQVRNSTLWASDPKQQLAYLATKRWSRLHCPDVIMGVYTPDELQEAAPRVERDITPPPATASGMNKLINSKPEKKHEDQPKNSDDRDPEAILAAFSDAAMNYNTISDLDRAYKYVANKLANDDERLSRATDVYTIRRDELNEVPM